MDDAAKSSWHCFFLAGVERPWMLGRRRAHLSKRTHAEICRLFPRIVLVGSVETWVTALRVPLGLESAQFSWFIMIYPVGPFLRYKSSPWKDNRRQRCFQGMKWPSLMIYSWLTLIYIYIHIILHTLCIYIVLDCIYNIFVEISIDIDWNKMNKAVEKNLQKAADASQSWEPVQTVWKRFQFARLPRSSSVSSISGNIQTDLNLFVRWQGVGNNNHCTNCTTLEDLILSDHVNWSWQHSQSSQVKNFAVSKPSKERKFDVSSWQLHKTQTGLVARRWFSTTSWMAAQQLKQQLQSPLLSFQTKWTLRTLDHCALTRAYTVLLYSNRM